MRYVHAPLFAAFFHLILQISAAAPGHMIPLGLIIMVKNEEHALAKTLAPFSSSPVQHILIYDTGSDDDTVACAQQWLQEHAIAHGVVKEEPFIDFATSRNKALTHAQQEYPEVAFWLMIDADWIVHGLPELYQFCQSEIAQFPHPHNGPQSYLLRIQHNHTEFKTQRLIRAHAHARFFGTLHETIAHPTDACVPDTIHIQFCPDQKALQRSKQRWEADAAQLKQEYAKNKSNPRTIFYLAQALEHLDKPAEAQKMYLKRAQMGDPYGEETWCALYKAACITEQLAQSSDSGFSWNDAFKHYRNCFVIRPKRAEPLIRIAMHYARVKEYEAAYSYALRARDIPIPTDECLPLERGLYDLVCDWIISACALEVEDYYTGYQALQRLITQQPNNPILQQSLQRYTELLQMPKA